MMPEGPYNIEIEILDQNHKPFERDGFKCSRFKFTLERYRTDMEYWEKELTRLHEDLRVVIREDANIYLEVRYFSPDPGIRGDGTWPALCSYYGPEKRFVDHYSS
jgi:hypothetical protein